ncbi:MAG TPA: type II secretion system F family protein [Candidatus Binataceae bacterium]
MDVIIASSIFAIVFVGALLVFTSNGATGEQTREVLRRISRPAEDDLDITRRRRPQEGRLLKWVYEANLLRRLEESMWQAGMYTRVADVLLVMVLLFGAGLFFGQAFWHDTWFAMGTAAVLGVIPLFYIQFRRTRRLRAFANQLPYALDLIKSSLEAGHSLQRALQVVVAEFADPLGSEFRTLLEQTRIGLPLPRALDDLLRRIPEDDLRLLVVAVKVQTQVGSSLAEIVGRLSEIVRTRQRLRLQVKALTAQARLGGMVVGFLPLAILAVFSVIQPGYTNDLFYDPAGQTILKTAAVLDFCAIVTIRWLLKVTY